MRNTMRKTMLGVMLAAGLLGTGAVAANAAPRGFYGRGYERPVVRHEFVRPIHPVYGAGFGFGGGVVDTYIPPCPGDGYVWSAGFYNGGIWVPGAWTFRGRGFERGYVGGRVYERGFRGRR
jgi:hypothetical protein